MAEFNATQAGTLSPEDYAQQQAINRQQQFAQMLMQQNQQPQGQMISGRYVAPSFFQMLQPVANMLAGAYVGKQSDTEAAKLAEKIRLGKATAEDRIQGLTLGTPDVATEMAGPYAGNVPMPVAVKEGTKPDLAAALRAINDPYSYGAGKELKPLIYKQLMPDPTELERNWKAAVKGGYKGSIVDYKNQMSDAERANYGLAVARARDEGIIGGGGGGYNVAPSMPANNMPVVNQPTNGSPVMRGNAPQVSIAPNAPAYAQGAVTLNANPDAALVPPRVSMAGVSPKDARKMAGEQLQTLQGNVKNAYEAYPVIKEIQDLLPQSSSGYAQRGWTGLTRGVGISTDMSKADTQLDLLAPKLTMLQPRFEGPQGVLDVKLYEAMAGRLADTSLPYEDRMAALEQLKGIYKRYAPNLDWAYAPKPVTVPNANKPVSQENLPPVPAGVDPAVWAVMTPAERSLWQKR